MLYHLRKFKRKDIINIVVFGIILVITIVLLSYAISSDRFLNLVEKVGIWGPVILMLYIIISHIISPLIGGPVLVFAMGLYGVFEGLMIYYIAAIVSAVINFWIARRYGRRLVKKLVGESTMKEIDQMTEVLGKKVLVTARLFGFPLYEIISYAAGLTKIDFKNYMIITIIVSAIPNFSVRFLFAYADFSSPLTIIALMLILGSFGAVFMWYLKRFIAKYKREK